MLRALTKTRCKEGTLSSSGEDVLLPQLRHFHLRGQDRLDPQVLVDFVQDRRHTMELLKVDKTSWHFAGIGCFSTIRRKTPEWVERIRSAGRRSFVLQLGTANTVNGIVMNSNGEVGDLDSIFSFHSDSLFEDDDDDGLFGMEEW